MQLQILKGDITKIKVDAIVNAANTSLLGGGGVDGAIHKAGGKQILEECRAIRNMQGGCKVGQAVFTTAGNLNAQYVIHTVGPKWNKGNSNESDKLMNCYLNSMKIGNHLKIESIAFPNISTGIYAYPKAAAAEIAIDTISSYKSDSIKLVQFICYDEENFQLYNQILENHGKAI